LPLLLGTLASGLLLRSLLCFPLPLLRSRLLSLRL
jgi:hypothetical protein